MCYSRSIVCRSALHRRWLLEELRKLYLNFAECRCVKGLFDGSPTRNARNVHVR